MSIIVRFELLYRLSPRAVVLLHRMPMPQVPAEGQVITIRSDPYRVTAVSWAIDASDAIFAYVDVQKASDFTVTIGGVEY